MASSGWVPAYTSWAASGAPGVRLVYSRNTPVSVRTVRGNTSVALFGAVPLTVK